MVVTSDYGKDDVVLLLVEFKDELDILELLRDAKIDGGSGTKEVKSLGAFPHPFRGISIIQIVVLALEQDSHRAISGCGWPC